jgi:hypothetical protein
MKRSDPYNPSQAVRLVWFLLSFVTPFSALAYVSIDGFNNGSEETLIRVLAILTVSMVVSIACGIVQPVTIFDDARATRAGRLNLCLAIIDTIIVILLFRASSSVAQGCLPESACRTYPVGWLALAGLHYCYAVWLYTTRICAR